MVAQTHRCWSLSTGKEVSGDCAYPRGTSAPTSPTALPCSNKRGGVVLTRALAPLLRAETAARRAEYRSKRVPAEKLNSLDFMVNSFPGCRVIYFKIPRSQNTKFTGGSRKIAAAIDRKP